MGSKRLDHEYPQRALEMMSFVFPLFGRFHPILVHLPIGILVFGVVLIFLSKKQDKTFLPAIQLAFLMGSIGGVLACISGFLQYQFEGFSWDTVKFHLIFGILTTAAGFFFYRKSKKITDPSTLKWSSTALIGALLFTGHLGGTITHGEGYFTEVMPENLQSLFGGAPSSAAPLSLPKKGWEEFTDHIIRAVDRKCKQQQSTEGKKKGVVFLLWGKPATNKTQTALSGTSTSRHAIIATSHPSPLGATKTNSPFLGSKCFSRCNEALRAMGYDDVDWRVDGPLPNA